MPKLDVSPPGMNPLEGPTLPAAQTVLAEEGFVYGHAPKNPKSKPPDIEGMMKAAGIPGPTDGGLPYSLEWYRGAKDRQAAREKERDALMCTKNEFRQEWANCIVYGLENCGYRVDTVIKEPQPLCDLAELLARTAHERPKHVERIDELRRRLGVAGKEKDRLNAELSEAREHLRALEDEVRRRKLEGDEEEEERLRLAKEERERKAKAERALQRAEALLRGEELPDTPSDGEEPEPVDPAAAKPEEEVWESAPMHRNSIIHDFFGTGTPPTPGATRGGLARELPPIVDPPPPPPLG